MNIEQKTIKYLADELIKYLDEKAEDYDDDLTNSEKFARATQDFLDELHDSCVLPESWRMFVIQCVREYMTGAYNDIWISEKDIEDLKEYNKAVYKTEVGLAKTETQAMIRRCIYEGYKHYRDVRRQDVLEMSEAWKDDWRISPVEMYEDFVYPFLKEKDEQFIMVADKKALATYCANYVKELYFY